MRSLFRPLLTALTLSLAIPTIANPALAQDAAKDAARPAAKPHAQKAAPAKPAMPRTMPGSPMAQIPFADQPFPLQDDGTFRGILDKIAADANRRCTRQEQFGWEIAKGDQERLDRIFGGTMAAFEQNGYLLGQFTAKSAPNPDIVTYLADKDKRRLLLVWAPMTDSAMLMMCDTDSLGARKP